MLYDVFLSYSYEDSDLARTIYTRLRRYRVQGRPLSIFFAPAAVGPGESIPRALAAALQESRHILLVVTPDWLESEWCRIEEDVAIWRTGESSERLLLPLLLRGTAIPPILARLRYVDFRDPEMFEAGLREVVNAIRKGIQRTAAEHAAEQQRRRVLNSPILPWLGFGGPSFDFVWPEMVIDPLVRTRKHPGPDQRLTQWIKGATDLRHACVAVVGEAGVGKTTVLRTLLLNGEGVLPQRRVFAHARELLESAGSLTAEVMKSRDDIAIIIDGLDEAGAANVQKIGSLILALQLPNVILILASRREFFDNQYHILNESLPNLVEILELCSWGESDILNFVERYSTRVGNQQLPVTVHHILDTVPGAGELLSNPMRLTLLLYLLVVGSAVDPVDLRDPYSLYNSFYAEWLNKERGRGTGGFNPEIIRRVHMELARFLYAHKGEVCGLARLDVLADYEVTELSSDSAFSELLTVDPDSPAGDLVAIGFRHETIGEFLIARDIIGSFQEGGEAMDAALRYTVADDVNSFVRSAMLGISRRTVRRCLANMSARYNALLDAEVAQSEAALRTREQLLYYIGRLPLDGCPPILREAFASEVSPPLRRSAALGAILHGELAIEDRYMELLEDPAEGLMNRSIQMVYFGDVYADLHTFTESGENWSKTRAAIYRRLRGNSIRDIRLRRWDLRTLHSFYETREFQPVLSSEEVDILASISLEDPASAARTIRLQRQHALLLARLRIER